MGWSAAEHARLKPEGESTHQPLLPRTKVAGEHIPPHVAKCLETDRPVEDEEVSGGSPHSRQTVSCFSRSKPHAQHPPNTRAAGRGQSHGTAD